MDAKSTILLIESSVQAVDVERRQKLANDFNLIHYDCESTSQFIEELRPGGRFANIVAIIRNGWHKAGKFANHAPFATEIVPYFPPSLKIICCSGHGYDAADIPAITARGIWYCNTPDACTEAVANTALSLVLDSFRHLSFAQWCARNDWMQSRDLGLTAVEPFGKSIGIVGLGDIGLAIAQKCEAAFQMKVHYQGPRRKPLSESQLVHGPTYHRTVDEMIPERSTVLCSLRHIRRTPIIFSRVNSSP